MDSVGRPYASRFPYFTLTVLRAKARVNKVLSSADCFHAPLLRQRVLWVAVLLVCTSASVAGAQQAFNTPDEAAGALVNAAKTGDRKAMVTVLGADGEDIVSSGDLVADATTRQNFVAAYDAKHQIAMEGDNKATVVVGQEDFPLPIPLARKDGNVAVRYNGGP